MEGQELRNTNESRSRLQPILTNAQNLNKGFLYTMMKPWIGNGILMMWVPSYHSLRIFLTIDFPWNRKVVNSRSIAYSANANDGD